MARRSEIETLRVMLDFDPSAVARRAEGRSPDGLMEGEWDQVRAALLVDAGALLGDESKVAQGEAILRGFVEMLPENAMLRYNLANALEARSRCEKTPVPKWYAVTAAQRNESRAHLQDALRCAEDPLLKGQCATNSGNLLSTTYRWAEAYDAYRLALSADPGNGVASGSAAQMLLRLAGLGIGDPVRLRGVSAVLAGHAQAHAERVRDLAGQAAVEAFSLLESDGSATLPSAPRCANPYEEFVARHHLALTPTLEGYRPDEKRWDDLVIGSIRVDPDHGPGIPPVFAMFNQLKADFATARRVVYRATQSPRPDGGRYHDTLDYATYGEASSALVLGHRAALDILDRVAVVANFHFSLGVRTRNVAFARLFKRGSDKTSSVDAQIESGNVGLLALVELCGDLPRGMALGREKEARHEGTHRFVVLHDLIGGTGNDCEPISHYDFEEFLGMSVRALQVARSAVLYFATAVAFGQPRDDEVVVPMFVPFHHYIRGVDDDEAGRADGGSLSVDRA